MTSLLNSRNIYKLIVFIFFVCVSINLKNQLLTLKSYNSEIATLNEKIDALEQQNVISNDASDISKKDNEDIARKDLKMYYPNETPFKGY